MDSKHSAPETTMTTTTSHVSNSSGASFPFSSLYPHDSNVDSLVKTNELNIDDNKTGTDGVGSENEGFMSSEEEFETAPERPILADPDEEKPIGGDVTDAPFVDSLVYDDDDDDKEGDGGVRDLEVEDSFGDGDRGLKGILGQGSVDKVGSEEKEMGVRESASSSEFVAEQVELEGGELKSEEVVEEKKSEVFDGDQFVETKKDTGIVEEREILVGGNEQVESGDKVVEADGLKFTGGGDAVVEAINVDLSGSGAAVVAGVEKGIEVTGDGSLRLGNGFDRISHGSEGLLDLKTVVGDAKLVKNLNPVAIDYVENAEVEPSGQKADVAGARKDGDTNIGNVVADAVQEDNQDRKKIEALSNESEGVGLTNNEENPVYKFEPEADSEAKENEPKVETAADVVELVSSNKADGEDRDISQAVDNVAESKQTNATNEAEHFENDHLDEEGDIEGSGTDGETEGMIFGSSEAAKQFLEELEQRSGRGSHSGAESSHDHSQGIDGQIVTDSDEEVDTDEDGEGKELFDSAALAALLKAASGAGSDGGSITITSQDGSRLFSVERPAGLGSSLRAVKPAARSNRPNLSTSPSVTTTGGDSESNLSEEEKKKLEELQLIRVKFLRLVQRLGHSPEDSIAAQVLYRLTLVAGRQTGQLFSLDAAKRTALQLEGEGKDDLNFSLNILVLGKTGVGKSATINSIFGEDKVQIHAFEPATTAVKEITGTVDGVKIRVIDTPGLKSSAMEQGANRKVLSSIKNFTKKCPPDIVLYVDRLDTQTRDLNDLPLLRTITSSLGSSIWRSAIVTLTHAASAPPDGPTGSPISYDVFVAQRSHVVQQSIGQAVGDMRLMNPSLMNPVSLVENHPACRKNRDGQKVLPNGLTWRPQLLFLCYSMKILSEASSLSKPQDTFDHRKLFGFRVRSPPLPYLLSWLLQSRTHPKLSTDQGVENVDSDVDLADLSDSDQEDEDEYDQLPPFKPLRKAQIAKLSKEQRKAYFEEYDYRVKLLQKKQWREELRRMREIKKKGKVGADEYGYMGEDGDQENESPAAVPVPLPDMVLPPSFDGDNPAFRYRFLEPTSQFLARPVLDTHGWDHDCGYDGVNLEHSVDIANRFPAAVVVQVTKDKKEFNIHLDSSISAKHGENGSSMAGFDIQNVGKQLAYILRGETKFKNFKKNKTTAGVSVTFLGENVATGIKVEDQIAIGKRLMLVGSTGTVRSQGDAAYGANLEVRLREADFPIGQDQSSLGLSLVKWRGDLALGANLQSQFSIGRSSKIAIRGGLNNKLSGQISVRTSTSDQLQIALMGIVPVAMAIYKSIRPGVSENYPMF